MSLKMTITFS